jgi:hypothetical protein
LEEEDDEKNGAPRPRNELEEPALLITNLHLPPNSSMASNGSRNVSPFRLSNDLSNHSPLVKLQGSVKKSSPQKTTGKSSSPREPMSMKYQLIEVDNNSAIYNYNSLPSVYSNSYHHIHVPPLINYSKPVAASSVASTTYDSSFVIPNSPQAARSSTPELYC